MSARLPRKTFAAPFVMTVAAACQPAPAREPVHVNPPAPEPQPRPEPIHTSNPPPPTAPPPAPVDQPPAQPPEQTHLQWTLTRTGDQCHVMPEVHCPKGQPGGPMPTCNPPPPRPYACPDGAIAPGETKVITQDGTSCRIYPQMPKCPPRTMCNPPPPRDVPCP